MISGVSRGGVTRCLPSALPLLFMLLGSGCDPEGYPTDLKYPTRTDIIVNGEKVRDEKVFHPDSPGQLDESLLAFKAKCDKDHNGEAFDASKLKPKDRQEIDKSLRKHFGTPAEPCVVIADTGDSAVDRSFQTALAVLQVDDKAELAEGSKLYRRHCLHCHGVTGNGRGPTAAWVHPHPRDYRKGQFKFISTGRNAPSRADLRRILKSGIDYTSMPSFGLLADEELDRLISYVIHLSLRGQAEEATMTKLLNNQQLKVDDEEVSIDVYLQDWVRFAVMKGDETVLKFEDSKGWAAANQLPSLAPLASPPDSENTRNEDIAKGYKLFIDKAGCMTCHDDFGRSARYKYDIWGTLVQPRNLTAGLYRGGRRPIDFFWRIRGGIKPSTMPGVDPTLGILTKAEKDQIDAMKAEGKPSTDIAKKRDELTDANIWRLVAFIQALPYPAMLEVPIDPKDPTKTVSAAVYPTPEKK